MVRDATRDQPPQPSLTRAVRYGRDEMLHCLESTREQAGPASDVLRAFIGGQLDEIVRGLEQAPSLEAQRDLLLGSLQEVLEAALYDEADRDQLMVYARTLERSMKHLGEARAEPWGVRVARQQVQHYAAIVCDSYDGALALGAHWQRTHGMTPRNATPYELAQATMKPESTSDECRKKASAILAECIAPYRGSLPCALRADSVGLIARAVTAIDQKICANDRSLADRIISPQVVGLTQRVLEKAFVNHSDITDSPQQVIGASRALANALLPYTGASSRSAVYKN